MFIFNRIFGLFVFMFFLIINCYFIKNANNYKEVKTILIMYVIELTIIAFFYIPYQTSDAYRLFKIINNTFKPMNFQNFLNLLSSDILFSKNIYFYLVARLGNEHFLPSLTSLIYYGIVFYIIYNYSSRNNIKVQSISKSLFYFMICGQFLETISGVRSELAFAIIVLCIYRELFQNKTLVSNFLLYFIAIGMHLVAIPIIIFRLSIYFIKVKKDSLIFKFLLLIFILFVVNRYGMQYLELTGEKAESYLYYSRYTNFWEYIKGVINLLINFYVLQKLCKNKNNYRNNYSNYLILFLIFNICFIYEYNIFHRLCYFNDILIIPAVLSFFDSVYMTCRIDRFKLYKYEFVFYVLLFFMICITLTRGDLTALKFF